jgi:hypothetical protein
MRPLVRTGRLKRSRAPVFETRLERFVKLLPADAIAVYLAAVGLGALIDWRHYELAVFGGATVLVPLLLYLDARSAGDRAPSMQYVLRTITFLAWAFVIRPSLSPIEPPIAAIAAIAVPLSGEYLVRIQQRPW